MLGLSLSRRVQLTSPLLMTLLSLALGGPSAVSASDEHGGGGHSPAPASSAAIAPGHSPAPAAEAKAAPVAHGEAGGAEPTHAPKKKPRKTKKPVSAHSSSQEAASASVKELVPLPPPDPVAAEQILDITLLSPTAGPLKQGELGSFVYELRNASHDVVVLKEVRTGSPEDPPIQFTLSGYGTLTYDERQDAYRYNPMVQQATPRIFEHGVMLPGEARRLELSVRVLDTRQTLLAKFQMMPMEQFKRVAFIPLEGDARQTVYQHLQNLPADTLKSSSTPLGPIHERPIVLWEELAGQQILLLEQRSSRTIPLTPTALTLEQARKMSGENGPATYWSWAQGWVIDSPNGAALVTAEGKRLLPRVDAQLFRDIDLGRSRVVVKLTAGAQVFKGRFATRQGDGVYTFGDFIEVSRDRLWEFFDLARIEHLAVTRESYLFDAYYFVLTPGG